MFLSPRASISSGGGLDRSPWGDFWFQPLSSLAGGGARVTHDTALGLPTVYACVRVLAESFACMPMKLFQLDDGPSGRRTRISRHWLYDLMRRPNRYQSGFEWRVMLGGHLALRGNAFCEIVANGRGEVVELLPLHPDRITLETLDNGSYRFRYLTAARETRYFTRDQVWHLRGYSSDGLLGVNPIELQREALGEGLSMQSYASRFFGNDARPAGWLEISGTFKTDEDRQEFRRKWKADYGGANAGGVAVLDKGIKFHELSLSNADAQFIEARAAKKSDIAAIFRVPPHMVGDLSRSTNNNIEQQALDFWANTMMPIAEMWEAAIETWLLGDDSIEVEFDMRRQLRGDSAARSAYYTGGINAGWMTRNEARVEEGFDPLPGLDAPLQPLNMIEAGEEAVVVDAPPNTGASRQPARAPARISTPNRADDDRIGAMLAAGAARLARRIAGGGTVPVDVAAEALALPTDRAADLLALVAARGPAQSAAELETTLLTYARKACRPV